MEFWRTAAAAHQVAGCQGNALRVVARRRGDDAARQLLGGQLRHLIEGAPQLEGKHLHQCAQCCARSRGWAGPPVLDIAMLAVTCCMSSRLRSTVLPSCADNCLASSSGVCPCQPCSQTTAAVVTKWSPALTSQYDCVVHQQRYSCVLPQRHTPWPAGSAAGSHWLPSLEWTSQWLYSRQAPATAQLHLYS